MESLQGTFSKTIPTSPDPTTFKGFPVDQDDWSCAQWKQYYENNKKAYGKRKALSIIDIDTSNIGVLAKGNYCRYDCDFVNFFTSEGLNTGNLISKTYCAANNVADAASNVAKTVSDFTGSKIIMTGLLMAGSFVAYKYFIKDGKGK
jgi:hypothetical protein